MEEFLLNFLKKMKFEQVAFLAILFFGICLRIVTPPFQVVDEINHFGRAWQVSENNFFGESEEVRDVEKGNNPITKRYFRFVTQADKIPLHHENEKFLTAKIPSSMIPAEFEDINNKFTADVCNMSVAESLKNPDIKNISFESIEKFLFAPLNLETTEILMIPNTGQYPPLAYFPQATVAFIGRNLNLSAGAIYYAMCFASLFFVAICVFFAMKILPEKKFLIFLLAIMPMFLAEIISTSADAVTYGVCILGSAWLLSQRNNFSAITYKEIFLLIVLSICLGLLKSVYGTILILYFLMPHQRFKNILHFVGFGIFLLALELTVASLWTYFAVTANEVELFSNFYLGHSDVNPLLQKNFILENPMAFLNAVFNTLTFGENTKFFIETFVGWLGSYNILLPNYFVAVYMVALIFFGSFAGKLELKFFQRGLIFFVIIVSIVGIFMIEYLIWTPVGGNLIEGIQGRYFIPIALFAFSIFSCLSPPKYANLIVLLIGIFSALVTIWTTYSAFY